LPAGMHVLTKPFSVNNFETTLKSIL
jgi:hypothetical protein